MIIGNDMIRDLIRQTVESGRLHHALLFYGPDGVGKYSVALELTRHLNCRSEEERPCGECDSCRRLTLPFPFHPDVQIFRENNTPLFLHRNLVLNQFLLENQLSPDNLDAELMTNYEETVRLLHSKGFLQEHKICGSKQSPIDMVRFSGDKEAKLATRKKEQPRAIQTWLVKKLESYVSAHCYKRTIQIDAVRNMQKMLYLHTFEGGVKTVIMDNADTMLPAAQNSLLKTLEEPPGDALIVLIVTNPSGLLSTIRSRCQNIPFKRLSSSDLQNTLTDSFGIDAKEAGLRSLMAEGSVSRALMTDWQMEEEKRNRLRELFSNINTDPAGWAVSIAHEIVQMSQDGQEDGQSVLFRWLHDLVCDAPDNPDLGIILPGNCSFKVDAALFLMDELNTLKSRHMYHVDRQLNLESSLLKVLEMNRRLN